MSTGMASRFAAPRRSRAVVFGVLAALALSSACNGHSRLSVFSNEPEGGETGEPSPARGGSSTGGLAGFGTGGSAGGTAGLDADSGVNGGASGAQADGGVPPFVDPSCPDAAAPPGVVECDVFGNSAECPAGEGCYPYIDHPFGMGCDQQTHGAVCRVAGGGTQGSVCGEDTAGCAPGFLCIVGAQAGKHCLRVCALDGSLGCPPGLICGETDARGVGVCA